MKMTAGTLSEYLDATTEVSQGHAAAPPELMHLVHEMDAVFHREFFNRPLELTQSQPCLRLMHIQLSSVPYARPCRVMWYWFSP